MSEKDYKSKPETKIETHKRLKEKIKDRAAAPEFYEALNEAIKCYTLNNTRHNNYIDICTDLRELEEFFFLQILLSKDNEK